MAYAEIEVATEDRVATITLNRPARLNAWTGVMADELKLAVEAAAADPEARVIVITGAGRGFCAGADMDRLTGALGEDGTEALFPVAAPPADAPGPDLGDDFPGRFGYLYACPKPIIAAINGPCAGIGLILTLYCDLRFAAADAKFTTAFAARGLIAEHGVAWLLPRLVGEANALDILLSARKFDGTEAAALGLVNKALPADAFAAHVAGAARALANDVSPRSVAVMKRQVRAAYHQSFAQSLALADREMVGSFDSFDFREGVQSFVERRPPAFEGR